MNTHCFIQTVACWRARHASGTVSLKPSLLLGSRLCRSVYHSRESFAQSMGRPAPRRSSIVKMQSDNSSVSLVTRIVSIGLVAGLVLGSFSPLVGVFRNATSDTGDSVLESQLGKVPVFAVTDESGRPFLSESDDHRLRRGYFFIQPRDALKYLERVQQDGSNGKVLTIGLNEAVKYLDKSGPAKSIPERYELFPDEHESEIAQTLTDGAFQRTFGSSAVPIFYVDGLGVKDSREGATVFPLFFEKEKLDETVENLKRSDPGASLDQKDVQVIDLQQTIKEIRGGVNPGLNRVVFVPLSEALQKMRSN